MLPLPLTGEHELLRLTRLILKRPHAIVLVAQPKHVTTPLLGSGSPLQRYAIAAILADMPFPIGSIRAPSSTASRYVVPSPATNKIGRCNELAGRVVFPEYRVLP